LLKVNHEQSLLPPRLTTNMPYLPSRPKPTVLQTVNRRLAY